jgi:flagellar biosynthesis/type III secretory pathway protein FliH
MAQYRFQQEYFERQRQQELRLRHERHDYDHDPYFYTAPIYRYRRGGGAYYETNQYGADLLRQAVNYGYQEGFHAGAADREDRWRADYEDSFAYQDANFGYDGYYVDQADYNFYFREGFRRGYEDGYNERYQYGSYSNGSYSVLGNVLSLILNLESLH